VVQDVRLLHPKFRLLLEKCAMENTTEVVEDMVENNPSNPASKFTKTRF
jgi:hypothetical protein